MVKQSLGPKKGLNRKGSVAKHVKASTGGGGASFLGSSGERVALDDGRGGGAGCASCVLVSQPVDEAAAAAARANDAAGRGGVLGRRRSMVVLRVGPTACVCVCIFVFVGWRCVCFDDLEKSQGVVVVAQEGNHFPLSRRGRCRPYKTRCYASLTA